MIKVLNVFLDGNLVGKLSQNNIGRMSFRYDRDWLSHPNRIPLSLSLPLENITYNFKSCRGFFSGVLPEQDLRRLITKNLGISEHNDFSLLEKIGGDCAGAISFLPEETSPQKHPYTYRKLTQKDLAETLRQLPQQPLLAGKDRMRLSLAGAQTKLSVCVQGNTILLPLDGAPSTHILKPAHKDFSNLVFNEAFCMQLAKKMGLDAADVTTKQVDNIPYLLITRYDRKYTETTLHLKRLHQEDFCQALGIPSEMKYQNEGGPSLKTCFTLIRQHSTAPAKDISRFLDAIIFNVLIGNNDAHGKNFSFLYDWESDFSANAFNPKYFDTKPAPKIVLAPLYDLVSTLHYPQLSKEMAMSIGGEYHSEKMSIKHFEKLAEDVSLSKSAVKQHVLAFTKILSTTVDQLDFNNSIIQPIKDLIKQRCQKLLNS